MRNRSLLQYYCSSCGKILNVSSTLTIQKEQLREVCPGCGASLSSTLENTEHSSPLSQSQQVLSDLTSNSVEHVPVDFQTAYCQIEDLSIKFAFDIGKIDSILDLGASGTLCIVGEEKYTQILIDRLCVHSMLPGRYGGIGSDYSKSIAIDAGNCTNVYQLVDFARQYGLEVKKVLQNIVVSRAFTIYQLADLIIHELPKINQELSPKNKLIVVYGLLHLFVFDPHLDKVDAKRLIQEIERSLRKLSKERLVVVSFARCNNEYEKSLFPAFDKRIEITNDAYNTRMLLKVYNKQKESSCTSLRKEALTLTPAR
jgi:DNA-directed RNA polymerase subunit RPC12/RpoP